MAQGQWAENALVLVPDPTEAYALMAVVSCRGFGAQAQLVVKSTSGGMQSTVPSDLIEQVVEVDPLALAGADDMVKFSNLTEASLLHNLRVRYAMDSIYSAAGAILISVNPFKDVPSLYTKELMQMCKVPNDLPAHPLCASGPNHFVPTCPTRLNASIRPTRPTTLAIHSPS